MQIHIYKLSQLLRRLRREEGEEEEEYAPEKPERHLMSKSASGSVPGNEDFQSSLLHPGSRCVSGHAALTTILPKAQTGELNPIQISNYFPAVKSAGIGVLRAVWVNIFACRKEDVKQSAALIICLSWLWMQLTAVSQFRAAFRSPLPLQVSCLFWVEKDAFDIFWCCHCFFFFFFLFHG